MKRMIGVIFVALILIGCASAEEDITFHSIPWLSDDAITLQALEVNGFFRGGDYTLNHENATYLIESEADFFAPGRITGVDEIVSSCDLGVSAKGKIAGYPVKNIITTYAYDGAYKLISVKVELINAKYDDIKNKLTKVYGEGQETVTEEQISSILWRGENNSAILLYTQSEGLDFTLMYGRLDAKEIVISSLNVDPDDVSGL